MRFQNSLAALLLSGITLVPAGELRAQNAADPAANFSMEEQLRLRRLQERSAISPAIDPAAAATTKPAGAATLPSSSPLNAQRPTVASAEEFTCAFDATIYELYPPENQVGRIDIDALNRAAATAEDFENALAALGTTRPIYRANQSIRLAGDEIAIGGSTPYITRSTTDAAGKAVNLVRYAPAGANFSITGRPVSADSMDLWTHIELSTLTETNQALSPTVNASMLHNVTLAHSGLIKTLKPFAISGINASALDRDGNAIAFIARIKVGLPQRITTAAKAQ
jgi:hypothetical protein